MWRPDQALGGNKDEWMVLEIPVQAEDVSWEPPWLFAEGLASWGSVWLRPSQKRPWLPVS